MPYCAQCGAQLEGRFCQSCGAANPASGDAQESSFSSQRVTAGLADNTAGALCYLAGFITGILFLLISPYNRNPKVRFHAFQAILFNLGWIVLTVAVSATGFLISAPVFLLSVLLRMGGFALWIYLMVRAYNNQPLELPIVGPLARQLAGSR